MDTRKSQGSKTGKRTSTPELVRSPKRLKGKEIAIVEEAREERETERQQNQCPERESQQNQCPEDNVDIGTILDAINKENPDLLEEKGEIVKKKRNTKAKTHKTLKTRSTPRAFVGALKRLTEAQKEKIRKIGFGEVLNLDIKTVPLCLAYWLVSMIDWDKLTLNMFDGDYIPIKREDVHIALGLPLGSKVIERKSKKDEITYFEKWVEMFGPNDNVKISEVIEKMVDSTSEGQELVICFLVLFYSILVESNQNGYANRSVTKMVKEEVDIKEMDWCTLVIDMLSDTTRSWEKIKNNEGKFRGPVLFLVLFYVDRVKPWSSVKSRSVIRSVPVFLNWTDEMLKKRETDELNGRGFGTGRILDQQCIKLERVDKEEEVDTQTKQEEVPNPLESVEKWLQDFATKIIEGAKAIVAVGEMAKKLPEEFRKNDNVAKLLQTAERLLGVESDESVAEVTEVEGVQNKEPNIEEDSEETIWENSQHPFWYKAVIACELEVKKAKTMKDEMKKQNMKTDWCTFNIFADDDIMMREKEMGEGSRGKGAETEVGGDSRGKGAEGSEKGRVAEEKFGEGEVVGLADIDEGQTLKGLGKDGEAAKGHNEGAGAEDVSRERVKHLDKGDEAKKAGIIVFKRAAKKDQIGGEPKRVSKILEALKSPYYSRIVDVSEKISDMEKMITTYVQRRKSSSKEHSREVLFKRKEMEVNALEFSEFDESMKGSYGIIRVWVDILNNKEKYRSKTSPARVFIVAHCDVMPNEFFQETFQNLRLKINMKMDNALENAPHINLKSVDMIVIAVKEGRKNYMVSFNIKGKSIHVLDPLTAENELNKKFGEGPTVLRDVIAEYMKERGLTDKGNYVRKSDIKMMDLPWAGLEKLRCAEICTMRHMEAYMGAEKGWECGLEKGSIKNIDKLKIKYINDIIMSEVNEVKDEVLKSAKAFAKLTMKGAEGKKLIME